MMTTSNGTSGSATKDFVQNIKLKGEIVRLRQTLREIRTIASSWKGPTGKLRHIKRIADEILAGED